MAIFEPEINYPEQEQRCINQRRYIQNRILTLRQDITDKEYEIKRLTSEVKLLEEIKESLDEVYYEIQNEKFKIAKELIKIDYPKVTEQ